MYKRLAPRVAPAVRRPVLVEATPAVCALTFHNVFFFFYCARPPSGPRSSRSKQKQKGAGRRGEREKQEKQPHANATRHHPTPRTAPAQRNHTGGTHDTHQRRATPTNKGERGSKDMNVMSQSTLLMPHHVTLQQHVRSATAVDATSARLADSMNTACEHSWYHGHQAGTIGAQHGLSKWDASECAINTWLSFRVNITALTCRKHTDS